MQHKIVTSLARNKREIKRESHFSIKILKFLVNQEGCLEGFFYRIVGFESDHQKLKDIEKCTDYTKLCSHLKNIYTFGELGRCYTNKTVQPALGELVVVKYEGIYYRARIQKRDSNHEYTVQLIDEGIIIKD